MKKLILVLLTLCTLTLLLTGCCLSHEWAEADCETPKTCTNCEKTEGEALGHTWTEADCETAKTCTACGKTEGEALGHNWQEATCEIPETCANCSQTRGKASHVIDYADAEVNGVLTYDSAKTLSGSGLCSKCGERVSIDYASEEEAALALALSETERSLTTIETTSGGYASRDTLFQTYGEEAVTASKLILREDGTMFFDFLSVGGEGTWEYVACQYPENLEFPLFQFKITWPDDAGNENWLNVYVSSLYTMIRYDQYIWIYDFL